MMRVIDNWAYEKSRNDVFAQIGEGGWEPEHIPFRHFLPPPEFKEKFDVADLVISHAGMGTILTALHRGKPILVMPKRASLGEHRNEHQTATARWMRKLGNINVAADEYELRDLLDHISELPPPHLIGASASESLVSGLREFIFAERAR